MISDLTPILIPLQFSKKINDNNKSVNERITTSNQRLHARVDDANNDIEDSEYKVRTEFNDKCNRLDDRVWKLGLHTKITSGDIVVLGKPEDEPAPKKRTPKK